MEKGLSGLGLREAGLKQADLWEDWLLWCVLREPWNLVASMSKEPSPLICPGEAVWDRSSCSLRGEALCRILLWASACSMLSALSPLMATMMSPGRRSAASALPRSVTLVTMMGVWKSLPPLMRKPQGAGPTTSTVNAMPEEEKTGRWDSLPQYTPKQREKTGCQISEQPSRAWAWLMVIEEVTKSLPLLRVSLPTSTLEVLRL